jgi:hypothetical protein
MKRRCCASLRIGSSVGENARAEPWWQRVSSKRAGSLAGCAVDSKRTSDTSAPFDVNDNDKATELNRTVQGWTRPAVTHTRVHALPAI